MMDLLVCLNEHVITTVGRSDEDKCVIIEAIVDNPEELVEQVIKNDCYISQIIWWDRALCSKGSSIGMGGPLDPRDPDNYYFAELYICDTFGPETTADEYVEYLNRIKKKYPMCDLYPDFNIYRK